MSKQHPVNKPKRSSRRQYSLLSAMALSCVFLLKCDSAAAKKMITFTASKTGASLLGMY